MDTKIIIVPIDEPKRPIEPNRTLHAWLGVTRLAHQSPTWDDARAELQQVIDQHDMSEKFYGHETYERMQQHLWRCETAFAHGAQSDRVDRAIEKADDLRRDLRGMLWLDFILLCILFVDVVVSLEGV